MKMKHVRFLLPLLFALPATQCTQVPPPAVMHVSSLPEGLCYLDTVAPQIKTDLKYAGSDNFVGRPIAGYTGRRAVLRRDAAERLKVASDLLAKQGYGLLVWDAYRPAMALRDFRAWSRTSDDSTKTRFYPNITKKRIYKDQYIGDASEHTWGIAVDITLIRLSDGKELDMGGRHDFLDPSSATESLLVTPRQRSNRLILRTAMEKAGMRNYTKEWWHYFVARPGLCFIYNFPLNDALPQK